jgi:hypothetical protein
MFSVLFRTWLKSIVKKSNTTRVVEETSVLVQYGVLLYKNKFVLRMEIIVLAWIVTGVLHRKHSVRGGAVKWGTAL